MTIVAIIIADEWHPVEVQEWLDAHPTVSIIQTCVKDNMLYIIYQ